MTKKILSKLSYGVYAVGAGREKKNAQIANSIMQISSEPQTISISLHKENLTQDLVLAEKKFSVSILSKKTSLEFIGKLGFKSGHTEEKLTDINFEIVDDVPVVIENSIGWLICKVIESIDVGTHTVFIAKVINGQLLNSDETMTYDFYKNVKYGGVPKNAPTYNK
ncbi:flavin reductase [Candidatus Woesearchaeota archaeon]|jgi:flavin reductase (DIM6/NTAB) family NADH-FMN oxidoreductase RutF|nr:flavin reductase [Candidatus Woesearchaeota archaeon]